MDVAFHDHLLRTGLPIEKREHCGKDCLLNKEKYRELCVAHCGAGGIVDQEIIHHQNGYHMSCPFGKQKVAVPLHEDNALNGVLFAVSARDEAFLPEELDKALEILLIMRSHLQKNMKDKVEQACDPRMKAVLDYLEKESQNNVSLSSLAQHLNLSESRTSSWVSKSFKQTFSQLLLDNRLNKAAHALRNGDESILSIALRFRFCDQAHFSNKFKQRFGLSPLRYRKEARESD